MEDVANQCGVGEEEIAEMMQDPTDPRWREGDLVKEYVFCQNSVQQYLDTVEDMNEELAKIRDLTAIDGANSQAKPLDKKSHRRQWKKMILVLKKDDITRHLEEAGRLNTFLARLTEQNQPITTTRRVSRRSTKHYVRIHAHAIDLYEIFQNKFPASSSCNCMLQHDVNMKLEFRSAKTTARGLCFHAIFTSSIVFPSRNWREMEMEPWKTNENKLCQDTEHHAQVRFADPPSPTASIYEDISDLCATIIGPSSSRDWLGFITSEKGRQHRIRSMDYHQRLLDFKRIETVSLAQVLRDKSFRQEQRSRLGLKLASSVMQLHTTDWLTDFWSKDDILFLRSLDGTVDFDGPLIRRSFETRNMDLTSISQNLPRPWLNASIPCLYSLGIVLLELWYREIFENLKNEAERKMPPEFSDPLAARRLANEMDSGPNFKNSALRCISGLDAVYTSLTEEKFQNEVEEKILSPLEEDLKFYCNIRSIEDYINNFRPAQVVLRWADSAALREMPAGTSSLLYSCIAHRTTILAEHSSPGSSSTAASSLASIILPKITHDKPQKLTFTHERLFVHYIADSPTGNQSDDGNIAEPNSHAPLSFVVVASAEQGRRIPFAYLLEMKRKFLATYEPSTTEFASLPAYGCAAFNNELRSLLQAYNTAPPADSLASARREIDSVRDIMTENIERVLERGERIDLLVDKTDRLGGSAHDFRIRSRGLRRRMWWKNTKLMIMIVVVVIFLLYLFIGMGCGLPAWGKCVGH
ncbi:Synaptobrevin [Penicillium expansum]|nr:Synaptobrevin [Penicillium expansum]KGO53720.1 Synaptobrevin [Penicillium expansum]